jgi:oligosaccharyltransferase complex subunit alpha (ribophorin I)
LTHQEQKFHGRPAPHVATGIVLHLPAGARDPYFIDIIGNVSTSNFRPTPSVPRGSPPKYSLLELKPRYPLLGGWNYSFTLGWDAPLADYVSHDVGTYILGVPFLTPIPGAAIDDGELKVILPEGATYVSSFLRRHSDC